MRGIHTIIFLSLVFVIGSGILFLKFSNTYKSPWGYLSAVYKLTESSRGQESRNKTQDATNAKGTTLDQEIISNRAELGVP
ncbi:hypothetical protein ACOMHN_027460 [Nucella lapillus]